MHPESHSEDNPQASPAFTAAMVVGLLSGIVMWILANHFLISMEMRATKYALGLISKVDFFGWLLLCCGIAFLTVRRFSVGISSILAGTLVLAYSYFWAMDIAQAQGADTFAKFVVAELGCFPEQWESIAADNGFQLPASADRCSVKFAAQ